MVKLVLFLFLLLVLFSVRFLLFLFLLLVLFCVGFLLFLFLLLLGVGFFLFFGIYFLVVKFLEGLVFMLFKFKIKMKVVNWMKVLFCIIFCKYVILRGMC